jgi:ubiquinol-cytochrome c reductase cytochrome c1 subunit
MIKRLLLIAVALLPAGFALAQEGGEIALQHAGTDITDIKSLQRGARDFMNYCSGCHSLTYLRYNRMAEDLRIPEADLKANLMFTSSNPFDGINSAMPAADAANWFGKPPPDLSLIARERGVDYLYSYQKGFYVDRARPWGVNNLYLPGVAMPHVLASLQGLQEPVYKNEPDSAGNAHMVLVDVKLTPRAPCRSRSMMCSAGTSPTSWITRASRSKLSVSRSASLSHYSCWWDSCLPTC